MSVIRYCVVDHGADGVAVLDVDRVMCHCSKRDAEKIVEALNYLAGRLPMIVVQCPPDDEGMDISAGEANLPFVPNPDHYECSMLEAVYAELLTFGRFVNANVLYRTIRNRGVMLYWQGCVRSDPRVVRRNYRTWVDMALLDLIRAGRVLSRRRRSQMTYCADGSLQVRLL